MVPRLAHASLEGHRRGVVAGLVRHVTQCIHPAVPEPGHQEERHQTSRDLHHRQHDRHVSVIGDVGRGQYAQRGHERAGRVRPVVACDRGLVDPPHPGRRPEDRVREDAHDGVCQEAHEHEPDDGLDVIRVQVSELLSAMPADGDQQVDRQRLVHDIGELEVDPEDRDQEAEVEEQEQRLEEVVPEVVPELRQDRFRLFLLGPRRAGILDRDLRGDQRIEDRNMGPRLDVLDLAEAGIVRLQGGCLVEVHHDVALAKLVVDDHPGVIAIDRLDGSPQLLGQHRQADHQQAHAGHQRDSRKTKSTHQCALLGS